MLADREIVVSLNSVSMVYKLFNYPKDRIKEVLSPTRRKYHRDFYALNNISLEINKGDILGVIGRNGSGKSTLLKLISGILYPTTGTVQSKGRIVPLLELGAGFDPEFTGMENIYFYCSIQGMKREEIDKVVPEILDFCEIGDFIHQPVKTYSSGMFARLAFGVSLNINPDILIVDEILSVGDSLFQRKSMSKMEALMHSGKTVIYVSHSDQSIMNICTKAIFLDKGELLLSGSPKFVAYQYGSYLNADATEQKILKNKFLNQEIKDEDGAESRLKSNVYNFEHFKVGKDAEAGVQTYVEELNTRLQNYKGTEYRNANIELTEIRIENQAHESVNQLLHGNNYTVIFKAKFNEFISKAIFTCAIRDKDGVLYQRFAVPGFIDAGHYYANVGEGSLFEISFILPCVFSPGTYFIGLGVVGEIEGRITNLNFILDCLPFEVRTNHILNFDYPIGIIQDSEVIYLSKGNIFHDDRIRFEEILPDKMNESEIIFEEVL